MRDAPDMPKLDEDAATAFMHAIGHLAPTGGLLRRIDARCVLITLALLRHLACLSDEEAGGRALAVIVHRDWARHHARPHCAVARQWRHYQAVGQGDRAQLKGLEEVGRHTHTHIFSTEDRDAGRIVGAYTAFALSGPETLL